MKTQPTDLLTIDLHHLGRPQVIGTYILLGDEPALVDPGPASTLPTLEVSLQAHGLALTDIRHVLLTHIHLDHAGASGTIVARNPRARVYVHARGAPHMIDPSRLLDSAIRLYGDQMGPLWGEMLPVPESAITTLRGGETLQLGSRAVRVFDAPGHAKHHVIYYDELTHTAFVGDNAGVRLPQLTFTRPATPPPDIDLEQWLATLDLLTGLQPRWIALTHFGAYADVAFHLSDYRDRLRRWAEHVRQGLAAGRSEDEQIAALQALAAEELVNLSDDERDAVYQQTGALASSWHGLARYWRKRESN